MAIEIGDYVSKIAQIAFDNLPIEDGWKKIEIKCNTIRLYTEVEANYIINNGEEISFNPYYKGHVAKEDDIANNFMELRKRMYELSPQQGAWFYCKITVEPSGRFETDFNYDNKPNFSYNPTLKKWEDDIKTFPRQKDLIPEWLNEILNGK
jgi:hypothetical protein